MASQTFFTRKTIAGFAGWSLLWLALQTFIVNRYTNNVFISITDAVISIFFINAVCVLIINNFRYYLPGQDQFWYITVVSLALGLVATGISTFLLHIIFRTHGSYNSLVSQSWLLRFALSVLLIACTGIVGLLWYSLQEQKEAQLRSLKAGQMLKDAELFKLRQQLQPHFLFNSLNSISALTLTDAGRARHMIQQLSDFLRSTLQSNEHQMISLADELHQLTLYLEIEKVRFGHRLQTDIRCSDDTLPLFLPALLLQPVVENAIKFGLYDTLGDVLIKITATKQVDDLIIAISNPFDADTPPPVKGTGFGLESIRRRLYLLFARQDLLQVQLAENIFTVTLVIPSQPQN